MKKIKYCMQAVVVITLALMILSPGTTAIKRVSNQNCAPTGQHPTSNKPSPLPKAVIFEDDFESYDDFVLDCPPWTQFDTNGEPTWGFNNTEFPNAYYTGAYIIFVPEYTEPPLADDFAHSGEKYAACFDEVPVDPATDDWLITPQLTIGEIDFYVAIRCVSGDSFWLGIDDFNVTENTEGITINFWAKTGSDLYEPDRFQVLVSTKTNNPADFIPISPNPYIEPPIEWTLYSYEYDFSTPELDIEVKGGLGVTATITNTGNAEATNCEVTFSITGGFFLKPSGGSETIAISDPIAPGSSKEVKMQVFGIGKPSIETEVTCTEGITTTTTYDPTFVFLILVLS